MLIALCGLTVAASPLRSQDWGNDPADDWYSSAAAAPVAQLSGWSFRAGLGFTAGPETLLLNFELPYAFDQWVSAGPMLQVGFDDDQLIVAPTANVTIKIAELPGESFDRVLPYLGVGLGFAVIEDRDRPNDNRAVGLLIPFAVGIEYLVSDRLAIGSQMTFNFLPESTLEQTFWYSWQVGGVRISF